MEVAIKFNRAQYEFIRSQATETFLVGGYGLGKSFALGCMAYQTAINIPGSITLITSPTFDTLRNSTLRQVVTKCWEEKFRLIQGEHFVINQQPPASWNIPPYSKLSNVRVVSWRNGSYTLLDSLENYEKHVGSEYDSIFVDEFQNCTPDARKVLIARLRGAKMAQHGLKPVIKYALTPPDQSVSLQHLKELIETLKQPYASFITGTSYLNKKNLPADYIENLIKGLDDLSVQRYIHGELVEQLSGRFAYAFKEETHVSDKIEFDESLPIHLWFDFNLGVMACLVVQLSQDHLHIIDEFIPEQEIDIDRRCARIMESRYADYLWTATITGDPAKGRTGLDANLDYYVSIMRELDLRKDQIKIRRTHPFIKDSQTLVNTMFNRFENLHIHPRCKNLIEDLKFCVVDEKGDLDKTNRNRTHYLDAMRYGIDMNFIWFLAKRTNKKNLAA